MIFKFFLFLALLIKMSNNASSAFALETQRAPSYALQNQSVVGYTPTGIIGTSLAPPAQSAGISLHTIPGQSYLSDPTLYLQLPAGSRVTQVVVEALFPSDTQGAALPSTFTIGLGKLNGPPLVSAPPENLNYLLSDVTGLAVTEMVMSDENFVATPRMGSVGYVKKFPGPETNYVNLGNGTQPAGGAPTLQEGVMLNAEFKVTISYVVIADTAASNLKLAINQARPSVRGA